VTDVEFPIVSAKDPTAEGVLATWFVETGDQVTDGALIAEVAVDKVDMEITAPTAGMITVLVKEGGTATQGTVIARID
jgi:pyruvate/2-oxoglutarate dehydrogenase complex dihydrolipoamide acyltransferase (E2) component